MYHLDHYQLVHQGNLRLSSVDFSYYFKSSNLYSVDTFESIPPETNNEVQIEIIKLEDDEEEEEQQQTQSSISISSFRISPPLDTDISLPTIIPNTPCISHISPTIPEENIWPSILSVNSSKRQSRNKKSRRLENPSNRIIQSHRISNFQNSSQVN